MKMGSILGLSLALLVGWAAGEQTLPVISEPGKILLAPSAINPSHKMVMMELARALQKRGHDVIVWQIGLAPDGVPVPDGVEERFWQVDVAEPYIRDMLLHRNASVYDHVWDSEVQETQRKAANWMMALRMCELTLERRKKDFDALVAEDFDVVIVDDLYNPCGLLHTGLQKSLFIYYSMTNMRTEAAWANQSPSPPSYVPVPGTGYTDLMDFWQRAANMLAYLKTIYIHQRIVLRRLDAVFQHHYPGVAEAFYMERNASLNYVNTPPIFDFTRPYMPRCTFVGALHCYNATKLPDGPLSDFVKGSDPLKGFVYVSMGMAVQWKRAPKKVVDAFLGAFKAHPQLRFVWQYDGPVIPDLPKNVLTQAWVPQQDVLGHRLCKGFVTGGGLNSVVESLFHNTPIAGIPILAEYRDNLVRVTERDAGVILDKELLSAKSLARAITKITTEHRLIEGAGHFSELIHDVPYTELNHAVFWVEFIIRHREIPQARSGADDLNIFQYFLVDVISFLAAVIFLALAVVYYVLKYSLLLVFWLLRKTFGLCFGRRAAAAKTKKKTE